ncbi:MAG: flagellar biosynthetic protein FliO [Bryobacteraceae bacterium]|nr:flagellar biosynthetic protein FliO [Bryobacteraceae bacterium]
MSWFGQAGMAAAGWLAGLWRAPGRARASGPRTRMERIERLMLSPQHSLHLVRVAGRALLVGVSPAGIQVLERIAESGTTAEASGGDGR